MKDKYKLTCYACYLGNFVQSAVICAPPLLFLALINQYGFTFEQMGRLVLINFGTQVVVDLLFGKIIDKHGIRPFIVSAHAIAVVGFLLFAFTPVLFVGNEYLGFTIATVVFAGSGGLLEVMLSPIVNAIPTEEKAKAMSLLHSFFSWGQLAVVLVSTMIIFLFGEDKWQYVILLWALLPLFNTFLFTKVPLAPSIPEEHKQSFKSIIKQKFYIVALVLILMGGATELIMSQWASTFLESASGLPKIVGDILGLCVFALCMGIGRGTFGKKSGTFDVSKYMLLGSIVCVFCYVLMALIPSAVVAVIACGLTGLGCSLLWPGSLSIASGKYPMAGMLMFSVLSCAGDIGGSVGPWLTGFIADNISGLVTIPGMNANELGLRLGMLIGAIFPLLAILCLLYIRKKQKTHKINL